MKKAFEYRHGQTVFFAKFKGLSDLCEVRLSSLLSLQLSAHSVRYTQS